MYFSRFFSSMTSTTDQCCLLHGTNDFCGKPEGYKGNNRKTQMLQTAIEIF